MSSAATISKNAAYLAVAELVSKLLQFFIIVYAARMLGAADYGKFSFALAFSMIIIVFFDAGIYTLLVREISKGMDRKISCQYHCLEGHYRRNCFSLCSDLP